MRPLARASLRALKAAGPLTLFLDVDGTLAPFVRDPARARIAPGAGLAIRRLRRSGHRVVLVSGRRAVDAARVVGVAVDGVIGSHGAECLDGRRVVPWLGRRADRTRIATARRVLSARFAGRAGIRVEGKTWSLAVHTVGPAGAAEVRAEAVRLLRGLNVVVRAGRRVVDVRPPGIDKGRAVLRWLSRHGAGTSLDAVVYAGDDTTDRDAFRALGPRAFTIAVGYHVTGSRYRSAGPVPFARWLNCLAEVVA
ncbi:MAG: trehalose-phosphatase [Gemmatimonadales bacterium]